MPNLRGAKLGHNKIDKLIECLGTLNFDQGLSMLTRSRPVDLDKELCKSNTLVSVDLNVEWILGDERSVCWFDLHWGAV